MKRIGVLFGVENSFPSALVERINIRKNAGARNAAGIVAEFVQTGAVPFDQEPRYSLILDRISHSIPFYRAFLKHAVLSGTIVINNPFWWSADDKFFNYALAARLGVAIPPTVMLPHKQPPEGTTDRSLRNLEFPLDWESVFGRVGEHGFLKPIDGGGWCDVHEVHSRDEFFRAYDESRDLCMVYQKAVQFTDYFRCYVVGQKKVRIMPYDPRRPHAERYVQAAGIGPAGKKLLKRIEQDALKLCRALGYDLNSVEFAVENGVPYAIDFMNPAPDADLNSVGPENFEWIVDQVAEMTIVKAAAAPRVPEMRWSAFLGEAPPALAAGKSAKRTPSQAAKKESAKKPEVRPSAGATPRTPEDEKALHS